MSDSIIIVEPEKQYWFAIKTRRDFEAEKMLGAECDEVFFPKETVRTAAGGDRLRAVIPHVLFIRCTEESALELERRGRDAADRIVPFWIYRNLRGDAVQRITDREIALMRLLTAEDSTRCEIYGKTDFHEGQRVRVTAGPFAGYEGNVRRVRKNRHVVVEIEGICAILLPYIHPDLLIAVE